MTFILRKLCDINPNEINNSTCISNTTSVTTLNKYPHFAYTATGIAMYYHFRITIIYRTLFDRETYTPYMSFRSKYDCFLELKWFRIMWGVLFFPSCWDIIFLLLTLKILKSNFLLQVVQESFFLSVNIQWYYTCIVWSYGWWANY